MDVQRSLPALAAGVILVVSVLSGPLFGAVDLSPTESRAAPGDGSATVEVVSVPDGGRLAPTGYTDAGYLLSLPAATVEVSNLSGNPMVVYKLRIREVGYVASTTHFLGGEHEGQQALTLEGAVLNRTSLPRESYRGELLVVKRTHEHETVLHRGNVTLRVDQ
jgi:hypothetical protein